MENEWIKRGDAKTRKKNIYRMDRIDRIILFFFIL